MKFGCGPAFLNLRCHSLDVCYPGCETLTHLPQRGGGTGLDLEIPALLQALEFGHKFQGPQNFILLIAVWLLVQLRHLALAVKRSKIDPFH